MNILDYFSKTEWECLAFDIEHERMFEIDKTVKVNGYNLRLRIHSDLLSDQKFQQYYWWKSPYLIHVDTTKTGKGEFSGSGHATDDKTPFLSWEAFKEWGNAQLQGYKGLYTELETEQLSLF